MQKDWLIVAVLYLAITVGMTWPISMRLATDLPSDLGDPAFVAGVIAWGSQQWLALFSGDFTAPMAFWNSPIFYPEPLALALSEHFALHSLLTLPVYAFTGNPVVGYNLLFLATFVVGAFGMYLLIQDVVEDFGHFSPAAFVAGLAFAFTPYRVATMTHLQVLSSHWMPLVLFAIHRYFRHNNSNWLLAAGGFLWAQNMSSGYYMLFFAPFVALFAFAHLAMVDAHRRVVVLRDLLTTALVTLTATLPFALPYLERTRGTIRSVREILQYSADLEGWLTASPLLHVWGQLQTLVKPEGFLFPGVTVIVLAFAGIRQGWRSVRAVTVFAWTTLVFSFWLSLGPQIEIGTQPTGFPALYGLLMNVPGFSVARAPARFAAICTLALAVLSGIALSRLSRRKRWVAGVCAALILAEGSAFPIPTNGTWTSMPGQIIPPPGRMYRLSEAPGIYPQLVELPAAAVIVHFPFGLPEREIQYGYYAMLHRRRILNGYSGVFPITYIARLAVLHDPTADQARTQMVLDVDRVTHAVVHTKAYADGRGEAIVGVLERLGWKQVMTFDGDYLLEK